MKKVKQTLCVVLCMLICLTIPATGIGETNPSPQPEIDISKEVALKAYFIGDPAGNADEGLAAVNAALKESINATLKPAWISWGDWSQKIPTILASGEPFDFIYTSNWCFYLSEGPKGAFYPLDDLLPVYAPTLYSTLTPEQWDSTRINGKIYMIPAILNDYNTHSAVIREDLRKKYNAPEVTDLATLGVYMQAIKDNEPTLLPFNAADGATLFYVFLNQNDWGRPSTFANGDSGAISYAIAEGGKAFDVSRTPEYEAHVKLMREWYEKGFWSRNVLSNQTRDQDAFVAGQSAITIVNPYNASDVHKRVAEAGEDWDLAWVDLDPGAVARVSFTSNGTAIYRNSPNPERSLMMMEQLYKDQDFYDLFLMGIKGVNYDLDSEGRVTRPAGVDPATIPNWFAFGMGTTNQKHARVSADKWEVMIQAEQKVLEPRAVEDALSTFVFDQSAVRAELSALSNVIQTYKIPLDIGMVDPAAGLPELQQKLEEAGIQKVIDEINRQLAEFNTSK